MQVNPYPFKSAEWYQWTHEEAQAMHEVFLAWVEPKMEDILNVFEIGCGLHTFYADYFSREGIYYVGVDHDRDVVDARLALDDCAQTCLWHDIMHGPPNDRKADLVFSRATIDHVKDPDAFVRTAIKMARKYVYIMTYRPPLVNTRDHKIEKGDDDYYYNDLSIEQLHQVIDEFPVKAREQKIVPTGRPEPEIQTELHIIVEV